MTTIAEQRMELISMRINAALRPSHLEVTDDSDKHIGHAGHQGGGRHFSVVLSADCLQGLSRVEAHRRVYSLFADLMPEQIHALKIKVI